MVSLFFKLLFWFRNSQSAIFGVRLFLSACLLFCSYSSAAVLVTILSTCLNILLVKIKNHDCLVSGKKYFNFSHCLWNIWCNYNPSALFAQLVCYINPSGIFVDLCGLTSSIDNKVYLFLIFFLLSTLHISYDKSIWSTNIDYDYWIMIINHMSKKKFVLGEQNVDVMITQ